ncbi:MAG: nitroreductase family protein [Verrucomicrobia bacterium]|nr:nitroreductase family protein [Verrucomicrobiota bacterium]
MEKGSEKRQADHPVEKIFLDRWSPRAMSGDSISQEELLTLFEAARWAPSSYNNQPWRFLYAHRDTPEWPAFLDLLVDANKIWAKNAAVLVLIVSKKTFDHNSKPSITHSFDAGAAWGSLALQASQSGLVTHGMQGFDYDKAKTVLQIPDEFQVEAMVAIGRPGRKEDLPPEVQERETPNGRRPLAASIFEGAFRS